MVHARSILLKFTMFLIVLCIVSILFFDDVINGYLRNFDGSLIESYLKFGLLAGVIIVCILWVSVYFMVLSSYKMQIKEKKLNQELYINKYTKTLNEAINDLMFGSSEREGLANVKILEDAMLVHLSQNELHLPLKKEIPKIEDLIQLLFTHIKDTLSHPEHSKRRDIHYALRLLYSDSKIASYCKLKNLYPRSFDGLHIDTSLLRGFLGFNDLNFESCVFYGALSFQEVVFNGVVNFNACEFEGALDYNHNASLNLVITSSVFKDIVRVKAESKAGIKGTVFVSNCEFGKPVLFESFVMTSLQIHNCVFNQSLRLFELDVDTLEMIDIESRGGIVIDSVKIAKQILLDKVHSEDVIDFVNFDSTCEIIIKHTRISEEDFVWLSKPHAKDNIQTTVK